MDCQGAQGYIERHGLWITEMNVFVKTYRIPDIRSVYLNVCKFHLEKNLPYILKYGS